MLARLTEDVILAAADSGAKRFMARNYSGASWIGSPQDVAQEARCIAFEFLDKFGNPRFLDPSIITRRVYFGLLDLIRRRSKHRTKNPAPVFYDDDLALMAGAEDLNRDIEMKELFMRLQDRLTRKEKTTLEMLRQGHDKATIARICNVSRSCITKRVENIRRKFLILYDARSGDIMRDDARYHY